MPGTQTTEDPAAGAMMIRHFQPVFPRLFGFPPDNSINVPAWNMVERLPEGAYPAAPDATFITSAIADIVHDFNRVD